MSQVREAVRQRYADAAKKFSAEPCCGADCCGDGCCGGAATSGAACGASYDAAELAQLELDASISLGCGNPLLLAELHPGEKVLDLGSGGGIDVLLSAKRVSPGGHAYGVDMTDEMLEVANRNKASARVDNATFLKGTIEGIPLEANSVDVVISNCVINLAEDKGAVLREAYRVLRPGGRLAVSDMVELRELPSVVKKALDAWAGCIAGTIPVETYRQLLVAAGFAGVLIELAEEQRIGDGPAAVASAYIRARKP
jgi:SAM-dependent methyltransferase